LHSAGLNKALSLFDFFISLLFWHFSPAIRGEEMPGQQDIEKVGEGVYLVPSKSKPGTTHRVVDGECDCKGFYYRGHCSHIEALEQIWKE
jgi:hypothetical protein